MMDLHLAESILPMHVVSFDGVLNEALCLP